MMRSPLVLATALLFAVACAKQPAAPPPTPAPAAPASAPSTALDPSLTVASVNGVPITAAELDEKLSDELSSAADEYVTKVHDMRKEALEQLVTERIVKAEAAARGIDEKALIKAEIEDKVPQPSDEELKGMFEKVVKPSRPDVTFEMAKPYLAQQMGQQAMQRRAVAFFDELKTKYKATTSLPPAKVALAEVAPIGPAKGPADAKVTIIEFSDFECPFCSRAAESVKEVEKAYGDKVRIVFRHYPLPFHSKAKKAAEAGVCANEQGKFWVMHDQMFAHQDKLAPTDMKELARLAGLDGAAFDSCLDSGRGAAIVDKDLADGKKARVNGTPAFFINGRMLSGAQPFEEFKTIIDEALAAK